MGMHTQNELTPAALRPVAPLRLARQLCKNGQLVDAYLIYHWLALHKPEATRIQRKLHRCCKLLLQHHPDHQQAPELFKTALHSPDSLNARLLSCLIRQVPRGQLDPLLRLISNIQNPNLQLPLAISWHARQQQWSQWQTLLSHYFQYCRLDGAASLESIEADHLRETSVLARLTIRNGEPAPSRRQNDSLVTVVMTAHNAATTVGYAVASILKQSHPNLELIAINDASNDGTAEQLEALADEDARLTVIHNPQRLGTYACRNMGLTRARGAFIANHDADDYAHPDRLRLQLRWLERKPDAPAVLGQWLRITPDGQVAYHNRRGGGFLHGAVATIMLRRQVIERIGYYDPVMCSADTEYLFRMRRVWGRQTVLVIRRPLSLAASLSTGLSSDRTFGTDSFLGDGLVRTQYRQSWEAWHKGSTEADLYLPASGSPRAFAAPPEMLAIKPA